MSTIKVPKQKLLDMDLPWEDTIQNNIIDTTRWSVIHEIIFKMDDKYYRTEYSVGATECQDEKPWEYDTEVTCTEVHQVEKTVKVWEAV